jgi:hypothetical protein
LTEIGKGKFVSDYFNEHGFVEKLNYTDSYGFIKFYISFDEIQEFML